MTTPALSPPVIGLLEANRGRFNAQFMLARHRLPRLDPTAFGVHLLDEVLPLVEAVQASAPEQASETLEVLYEFSLELVGKLLTTRYPVILEGWRRLLGGLPHLLAASPRAFAGSVTNALYNLAQTPGARPQQWIDDMLRVAALHPDVATLLEAGQVCAWRAGLAHLREGALEVCGRLMHRFSQTALGLPVDDSGGGMAMLLDQLRADPWLDPAAVGRSGQRQLQLVQAVGGFRGFGGPFLRPPRVSYANHGLHVSDGQRCWLLLADCFGAVLLPAAGKLPRNESDGPFKLDRKGTVSCGKQKHSFPELKEASSWACSATTLAATSPLSHRVNLVALQATGT